jgi:hypothetical protein
MLTVAPPLILIVAIRPAFVVFGLRVNLIVPLAPDPEPLVMVIHDAVVVADHPHAGPSFETDTSPGPPVANMVTTLTVGR